MIPLVSMEETARLWPEAGRVARAAERETELEASIRQFLAISAALDLTAIEERTLLDLPAHEMALLRVAPGNAFKLGGSKLERRANYAIPIMQRMIAAMAS